MPPPPPGFEMDQSRAPEPIAPPSVLQPIDGDTLRQPDNGRVRVWGMDAPELKQEGWNRNGQAVPIGQTSLNAIAQGLANRQAQVGQPQGQSYGRTVAPVTIGDLDLGGSMIRSGNALAAPGFLGSDPQRRFEYMQDERLARQNRLGIHQTYFQRPEDFRHDPQPLISRETVARFFDTPTPMDGMRPEDEREYFRLLNDASVSPEKVAEWTHARGWKIDPAEVSAARKQSKQSGQPVGFNYLDAPRTLTDLGDGATGAAIRGFGSGVVPQLLDELGAVPDSLGLTPDRENVWNSDRRWADIWYNNQQQNSSILGYDAYAHPYATLGGELAGGLIAPVGAKATSAIDLAKVGGAYGLVGGFGAGEGSWQDRAPGALMGGGLGVIGGVGVGKTIQAAEPYAARLMRYMTGKTAAGASGHAAGDIPPPPPGFTPDTTPAGNEGRSIDRISIYGPNAPMRMEPEAPVNTRYPGPVKQQTIGDIASARLRDRDWIDIADVPPPPPGFRIVRPAMAMEADAMPSLSQPLRLRDVIDVRGARAPLDLTAHISPEAIAHVERAQEAWPDTLRRLTNGEAEVVENAAFNRELGFMDMRMGKAGDPERNYANGYGLAHIIAKHGHEGVVDDLPTRIAGMRIVDRPPHKDRVILEGQGGRAAVATTWHGDQQAWVLTAFDPNWKPPLGETATRSPIGDGPGSVRRGGMANIGDEALSGKAMPLNQPISNAQRLAIAQRLMPGDMLPIPSNIVGDVEEAAARDAGRMIPARPVNERGELSRQTVRAWNGAEVPKVGPIDMVGWLRLNGGLADQGGELSHMGMTNAARRGMDFVGQEARFGPLVNHQGMTLDDAAQRAWEAGYFPDHAERPSVNEFLDTLRDTYEGRARAFLPDDMPQIDRFDAARADRLDLEQRIQVGPVWQDRSVPADEPQPLPPVSAYEEWPQGGPDFAGNINLGKLDSPQDISRALAQTERRVGFDAATRGRVTQAETERLASELGMTADDLLSRRKGQAFNAEEALAARQILAKSSNELVNAARRVRSMENPGDDALADFRQKWMRHVAIQEQVAGATAEAGRALAQFKMTANSRAVRGDVLASIVRGGGGLTNIKNAADVLLDAIETSPGNFNVKARDLAKPTWRNRVTEYYINSLLSGPQTHVVNMVSNTLTAMAQIPEFATASVIGRARQIASRDEVDRIVGSEVGARAFGLLQGAKDGAKLFARALRTGEASDFASKVEGEEFKAIPGLAGEIVRIPTRFLTAEDELFKGVARRMEMEGQAVRIARREGLKGQAAKNRIAELVANPTDDMVKRALDYGRYLTFQTPLGPVASKISGATNSSLALKVFLPFVRTPTNLLKFAVERSPAAWLLDSWKADFMAGGARRDLALARAALGTGFGMAMYEGALNGQITGSAPTDPKKARLLYADGWQPYSLKIGDTYYSYKRLDPLSTTIGVAADLAMLPEGMSERQKQDKATLLVASIMGNLASKTWLSGMSDLVSALDEPGRYADNMLQRLVGSFLVPAGVAQVARTTDPARREVESMGDAIKSRVPGLSDDLLPRRDVWGRPIVSAGGIGPDFLSPVWVSEALKDPVNHELMQTDYAPGQLSKKVGGRELTPQEYDRYQELAGGLSHERLTALVTSPRWRELDSELRAKLAKRTVDKARDDARATLFGAGAKGNSVPNVPSVPGGASAPPPPAGFAIEGESAGVNVYQDLQREIPGIRFTSGYRSPEYNASLRSRGYHPARNSSHLDGSGLDMLPPPGRTLGWLKDQVVKLHPTARLLVHDGHLHATFPGYFGAPVLGGARQAGNRNPLAGMPPPPPGFTLDR